MSRKLFRLVGVWSGCWVVRDAVTHHPTTTAFNKLVRFVGTIIV
jgi:hypothetical protein